MKKLIYLQKICSLGWFCSIDLMSENEPNLEIKVIYTVILGHNWPKSYLLKAIKLKKNIFIYLCKKHSPQLKKL